MTPAPKDLARYGRRGDQLRVFLAQERTLVRVQHRLHGAVKLTRSWPNTPENRKAAIAWAKAYFEERAKPTAGREELTYAELFEAFKRDQFRHLRPRTQQLYTEHWAAWMDNMGSLTLLSATTPLSPGEFRAKREKKGLGPRSIRNELGTVRTVFRWAEAHGVIARNPFANYRFKIGKEQRPAPVPEYSSDEYRRILAQLHPAKATQWRAWVGLVLCGYQGARQNAVLHLQEDDVVLGFHDERGVWQAGEITWRAAWDKNGTEWTQPLRYLSQMAIEVALEWRMRLGYEGPWLLPAAQPGRNKGETYDQQSLWAALQTAELRAGVEKKGRRAAHSARRMLAGDVWEETGNALLAIRAIGDSDPRRMQEYLQTRDTQMIDTFARLDAPAKKES